MTAQANGTVASAEAEGADHAQISPNEDIDQENGQAAPSARRSPAETPLPWRQLGVLILMRFAEPIAFTQVFPYINRMVLEIGAAKSPAEVGFYGGMIESLFALTQLCTVLAWGSLSDRIGRKKVMLIGLSGTTMSQIAFGFSKTFSWAVASRCLAGALNGNVAIIKSIVGELTDSTNQARAFSFLPLCWAVGCTIGPLIGGYLSHPEEQYPGLFGEGKIFYFGGLWMEFPYLLPCLLAATSTSFSIVLGFFFLEETLPSIVAKRQEKIARQNEPAEEQSSASDDASTRPLLGSPNPGTPSYGAMTPTGPTGTTKSLPGGFAGLHQHQRETRGRSRIRVGQVQSWFSGYTPTGSRAASRAASPGPSSSSSTPASPAPGGGFTTTTEEQPTKAKEGDEFGILRILSIGHIQKILLSYSFLALAAVSIDAVLVLFLYEPITLGGLSFTSQQTGTLLFLSGAGSVLVQLLLFPALQKRMGTLQLYRLSLCAFPMTAATLPIANFIALAALPPSKSPASFLASSAVNNNDHRPMTEILPPSTQALVWLVVLIAILFRMTSSMSFSCNMLLVNQSAVLVKGAKLGTLNGLAQMSSSVMRAAGPYAASSLFAFSVQNKMLDGKLIWPVLVIIGITAVFIASRIADLETHQEQQPAAPASTPAPANSAPSRR